MINKKARDILKSFLNEEVKEVEGQDSLDAQVDKYLMQYEKEAKLTKKEGLDHRFMSRRFFLQLTEAEDDTLTSEDIDVRSFAADLVRLIDNYDNLLEVRRTLVRRAVKFISDAYEEDVVNSLKEILEQDYDVSLEHGEFDKYADDQPPLADRAGPEVGGAA